MEIFILGAGFTGLSTAFKIKAKIFEAENKPGGICTSYNIKGYRFEIGGGHWIFNADEEILRFINWFASTKKYKRKSAVFFPDMDLYVPYPIQNHLFYLPDNIRRKSLDEILRSTQKNVKTMEEWLEVNFGKTLCELFFFPFHELYTVGLYKKIAPQDRFKTPVDKNLILKGAKEKTPPVGYNTTFVYPIEGLNVLAEKIAEKCKIEYNKKIVKVNLRKKEIFFADGSTTKYEKLISTIPLNKFAEMAEISIDELAYPYTSVLVLNIGAKKGRKCPDYHWIYIPKSKGGFYRVGFYSNVDNMFLPEYVKEPNELVSIYVEKAFLGGKKPTEEEIKNIKEKIIKELIEWEFIAEIEVIDTNWIEVGYTWEYPDSNWKNKILEILFKYNIISIGRYGKWKFQGIAESIKEGLKI